MGRHGRHVAQLLPLSQRIVVGVNYPGRSASIILTGEGGELFDSQDVLVVLS